MHGLGSKIHLKSTLAPQPVPLKLYSTPPSKAHSPRIYIRAFPNFLCLYLRACAFWKWWGAPFENARVWAKNPLQITIRTPAGFLQTRLKLTFQRSFLHEYASDHSQLCCAYSSGHVLSKKVWVLDSKNVRVHVRITYEITLSTPAGTAETWFNATF